MTGLETRPNFPPPGQGVYLLDDHELVRGGFRSLLEPEGIPVKGESLSAREAVRNPALRPQLAILDENLPDGTGTAVCRALRALRAADPSIRCLILSDTPQETTLIDAILSDAWGCLSKEDDDTEQLRLIRQVLNGCTAFSEKFQPLLNQATLSLPEPPPSTELSILTGPEMNVVIGLGRGLTNTGQGRQRLGLRPHQNPEAPPKTSSKHSGYGRQSGQPPYHQRGATSADFSWPPSPRTASRRVFVP